MTEALPLSPLEVAIVFAPAVVAYALLTAMAVVALDPGAARDPPHGLPGPIVTSWRLVAWGALAALTLHVALLWAWRYGFDLGRATRNGWAGFVVFHAALVLAWTALLGDWRLGWRRRVLIVVWLLVTSGAVPAPFRYPIVRALAPVVVAIAASGAFAMAVMAWRARREPRPR